MNSQTFPNAVTENKTTVEDRHNRLFPGKQITVYVDLYVGITRVDCKSVGAVANYDCLIRYP